MHKHQNQFMLPDGTTRHTMPVTVGDGQTKECRAASLAEIDDLRQALRSHMERQGSIHCSPLKEMLEQVVRSYERTAGDALAGAESVRNDVLVYLRSVAFVIESVTGDHISHAEAKARLRGAIAVIEQHIRSLRDEQFNFHGSTWRRDRDLFSWREPEQKLRGELDEARAEIKRLEAIVESQAPTPEDRDHE